LKIRNHCREREGRRLNWGNEKRKWTSCKKKSGLDEKEILHREPTGKRKTKPKTVQKRQPRSVHGGTIGFGKGERSALLLGGGSSHQRMENGRRNNWLAIGGWQKSEEKSTEKGAGVMKKGGGGKSNSTFFKAALG